MKEISSTVTARVDVPRDTLFDWFIPVDLPAILVPYGPIPAVVRTSAQSGPWDRIGSTRTVHLADGNTAREAVTEYERPVYFAYRVAEFSNLIGRLASEARGKWWFTEAGDASTDVKWTYLFVPRSLVSALVLFPVVRLPWRGFMRASMRQLKKLAEAEA
jgi:hypothetical protein